MVDAGLQAAFQKQGNDWHHLLPRYAKCLRDFKCLVVVSSALEMPKEGLGIWECSREGCCMKLCHLLGFCEPEAGTSRLVLAEVLLPCSAQSFP